jgi:DNA (cytosine-5)-methyltransferase 1
MPYELSEQERAAYRERSNRARAAKRRALGGDGPAPIHPINIPRLDPLQLMPQLPKNGLRSLSLFTGGGGFDLGFDRAGFEHVASHDILDVTKETLAINRPEWLVFSGSELGDVRKVDWARYRGKVDVLHGGPPCQPFSSAGKQKGASDARDMFPEFVRAVMEARPQAFVAENVPALMHAKFSDYVRSVIIDPLSDAYDIVYDVLRVENYGVPEVRARVLFVGFRRAAHAKRFRMPAPTHCAPSTGMVKQGNLFNRNHGSLPECMGVRRALGLPDIGVDGLAPTIRSGFTGPRFSTSVLNSVASQKVWTSLKVWPNGVARNREEARAFVPENKHFRLSIQDVALIQGFPEAWRFSGAVYACLGQIGNAVAPPMAYEIARAVALALA